LPQLVAVGNDHGAILSGYAVGPGGRPVRMIQRQIDAGDDGRFLVQVAANREIVERARTQVGNLAHALKTPLSVLMNEADSESLTLPEKVREQAEIMSRQVSFYLDRARAAARARTFGAATDVKPVVEGLVRTYENLHGEQALSFDVALQPGLRFRGEAQDLTDLIGNLL